MLYFSQLLTSNKLNKAVFEQIKHQLNEHKIDFKLLPKTKDIWARDYMPIQVNKETFVEYNYHPDYLIEKKQYMTNTGEVCKLIGIETIKTKLVLDGGNIVKHKNKAIVVDKIFSENKFQFTEQEVIEELKKALKLEYIFIIPWDRNEIYGHADGMVRFVDDKTVLTHGFYRKYKSDFKEKFYDALKDFNLIELNFNVKNPNEEFNWGYINFLQTPEIILIPVFSIEEDAQAISQIAKVFPEYASKDMIKAIEMKSFVQKGGGALNCISWEMV